MTIRTVALKTQRLLANRWFFIGLTAFFVFQAVWIALSAKYPMAFDEDFHLGIIKIYAEQLSPFLTHTPPDSAKYGALISDPSYLFHYLMSFPYRIFMALFHNETAAIIFLRLIDVALASYSIVLFRQVLRRAQVGAASANTVLGVLVMIPIFPLMAGQINYDNLLMVGVAWLCLAVQSLLAAIRRGRLPVKQVIGLVVLCCLGSLVKYAFLPLALAAVGVVGVYSYRQFRASHYFKTVAKQSAVSWKKLPVATKIGLTIILVVSLGLFAQRYVVNIALYHTPVPGCDKVLDTDSCQAYGPWARDYNLKQAKNARESTHPHQTKKILTSPIHYAGVWLYGMWYRLFFMINGNLPVREYRYQNYPPLPIIGAAAIVIAAMGFGALAWRWKRTVKTPEAWFFVSMIALYTAALWWQNYTSYMHTGQAVAVNGRYLLPILVPLGALMIVSLNSLVRMTTARSGLAVLGLLLFLSGSSLVSFLVRSNEHWYWQNSVIRDVNLAAQKTLDPLVWHQETHHKIPEP